MSITRRDFIEAHGATCKNWRWSWCFVNRQDRFVIFGAWDILASTSTQVILKDEWEYSENNRRSPSFAEAKEYVSLVMDEGFKLFTFQMGHALADTENKEGTAKIKGFIPELFEATLVQQGSTYLALLNRDFELYGDEIADPDQPVSDVDLLEGGRKRLLVSAVERNQKARAECLKKHGFDCRVCGMNFREKYGEIGEGFIHVHHLKPISGADGIRTVDPLTDLVPVCPNCHAMLHRRTEPYSIEEMREILSKKGPAT